MRRRAPLVAALAAVLAACSGGASTPALTPEPTQMPIAVPTSTPAPTATPVPTEDPLEGAIEDAAAATIDKSTAVFSYGAVFEGTTLVPDGTRLSGDGSLAWTLPRRMALTADFRSLGVGKIRLIVNGDLLYVSGDALKTLLKSGQWLLVDLTSTDPRAISFRKVVSGQNDVSLVLYFLYTGVGPVADRGTESLDGAETHRYTLSLDLEARSDSVPDLVRSSLLDNIAGLRVGGIERKLTADVWIGTDGLVHKVSYEYTLGTLVGGGKLRSTYVLSAFGETLHLGIPAKRSIVLLEDVPRPS